MRKWIHLAVLVSALGVPAKGADRNVLVEMFTNSHCGLCPPAHSALKAHGATSPNASSIRYIYYHVTFPYSDDPLAQANTLDASGRNQYYGPFSATPVTFFDGTNQGNAYSSWASTLDGRVAEPSPLTIDLEGTRDGSNISVTATVQAEGPLPAGALIIHFVIVEEVAYAGRNGVTPQPYVMRKMIGGPNGQLLSIASGETKIAEQQSPLTNVEDPSKAGVVVFVQASTAKTVLQSEYISYGVLTGVPDPGAGPFEYRLDQNYPNPFNPSTQIGFALPEASDVRLAVFDLLGREIRSLVQEHLQPGSYEISFDGDRLPSGVYFYRLEAGGYTATRRLVLMK